MSGQRQSPAERAQIAADWARIGGGFAVAPSKAPVLVEELVARSARQSPADYRLFFVAASWLSVHHELVDTRRLGRELDLLDSLASAVGGALLSVAYELTPHPGFLAAQRHCRPLAEPRPLFDRAAGNSFLRDTVRADSLPLFARWGLWHDEVSPKTDAIRPIRWLLDNAPELRARALLGPTLEAQIVECLLAGAASIAQVARATRATYAAAHEAATRLIARGVLTRSASDRRLVVSNIVADCVSATAAAHRLRKAG